MNPNLNALVAANKSRTASRDQIRHHHAATVAVCARWRSAPPSSPAFTTRAWFMVTFLPTMLLLVKVTPPMSG